MSVFNSFSLTTILTLLLPQNDPEMPENKPKEEETKPIIITPISKRSKMIDVADIKPRRLYRIATKVPQSTVNDPYTGPLKQMFEDSFNGDNTVKQAILRKVQFTLGRKYKIELQVNDKSLGDDERDALLTDDMWKGYLEKIREIDERVKIYHNLKAMMVQSAVFGRSALHIIFGSQTFQDGTTVSGVPVRLDLMTSKFLNKVFINPDTWAFEGVIYTQSFGESKEQNTLKPEELIYFAKNDYHITPRTLYYGRSDIEAVAHLSELNRRMDEIDFKEIVTQAWAGMIVLKINSRNPAIMNQMADQFLPGKTIVHNQDMSVDTVEIPKDLNGLIALRESVILAILRGLNVPSIIMNFENITNRATADDVLLAWQKSTLEDDRTWLKETVQAQWYNPLLAKLSGIDADKLPVRVVMKFDTITIADWADVSDSALKLWYAQIISREKLLTLLGMEDVIIQLRKTGQDARLKEYYEPPEPEQQSSETKKDSGVNPKNSQSAGGEGFKGGKFIDSNLPEEFKQLEAQFPGKKKKKQDPDDKTG